MSELNNKPSRIYLTEEQLAGDITSLYLFLKENPNTSVVIFDYDDVLLFDSLLPRNIPNNVYLINDGKRIDRSYIDIDSITGFKLIVPLSYLSWGIKFDDYIDTYLVHEYDEKSSNIRPLRYSKSFYTVDDQIILMNKIKELAALAHRCNDKEKVMLVSDYIQSSIQYIDSIETHSHKGIYVTPYVELYNSHESSFSVALNKHYGVCSAISQLSMLLLNNPYMDIESEVMRGNGHAWNKVNVDGKNYYFDNTWSITRNDHQLYGSLMASSFTDKYLLFGSKTANEIEMHSSKNIPIYKGSIEEEDATKPEYKSKFTYSFKPVYYSYKKED